MSHGDGCPFPFSPRLLTTLPERDRVKQLEEATMDKEAIRALEDLQHAAQLQANALRYLIEVLSGGKEEEK